ncbi:hypothetical protein J4E91_005536 [Alternaria rosae]|nr:hypothetical protein J4E91_005536 [Alternaria rosae]
MAPGSDSTVGGDGDDDDDDGCPEDAPKGVDAMPIAKEIIPNATKNAPSWKGCDCLATAEIGSAIVGDMNLYDNGKTWLDEQQQLIDALGDERPFCIHGASPRGDRIPRGSETDDLAVQRMSIHNG